TPPTRHAPLGTNLSRIDDWSPEYAFADVFKSSRNWISGTWGVFDDGRTLDLDAHGWLRSLQPGQIARTIMMNAAPSHYPSGLYSLTYDGQAAIMWSSNVRVLQSSPGRQTLSVDATQGSI